MNKFAKKNIMLVTVLVGSGIVAAALLICAGVIWIALSQQIKTTQNVKSKIKSLVAAELAPGLENELRVKQSIDVYKVAAAKQRARFASPLQPAVDEFIKELQPPIASRLTDDQHERLRVRRDDESEMSSEQIRKLPVRKLTQEEFKELFRETFESDPANSDEVQRKTLATQNFFIPGFRSRFPNWSAALAKFVAKAKTLTSEPIGQTNDVALLLSAIGFPRAIPNEQEFVRHMESYRAAIVQKAETAKLEVMPAAANFLIDSGNSSANGAIATGFSVSDIREIFFQWDVFGDIVDNLGKSGVRTIYNIRARNFAEAPEEGRKLGNYSESIGSYKYYHYTVEISGTLKSIRELCANLDTSYKHGRPYIVRAVTLYAEENGAAQLMGQNQIKEQQNQPREEEENTGGRRRRRRNVESNADAEKEQQVDPEELRAQEEARIKALPIEQRPGYGVVLVGAGDMYRAMVDVDYVVLEQNQ